MLKVVASYEDPFEITSLTFNGDKLLAGMFKEHYSRPITGYFIGKASKKNIQNVKKVLRRMALEVEGIQVSSENYPDLIPPADKEGAKY
jgi:hypothetical protein